MTRVAVYMRVSTEDQAKEGFSLDAQKERLRSYCKARGWDIASEYVDDGQSGRDIRRPAYRRMLEERDQWDTILVVKMDRIHRNSRNFMEMMDDLRSWEKEFSSVQESLDTSTAMGRFVVDIIQRIAQLESEQIGERVYMGMRQKASSVGGILGFNHPYGYDYVNGELHRNEREAEIVEDVFEEVTTGKSTGVIAESLNNQGIPTKTGKKWHKETIAKILKNPLYAGYQRWDDIIRKAEHPVIVDVDLFNRVQRILVDRIRVPRQKYEPIQLGKENLTEKAEV
jgi:DNA invertase Pin-like site-specific DNA recombinase